MAWLRPESASGGSYPTPTPTTLAATQQSLLSLTASTGAQAGWTVYDPNGRLSGASNIGITGLNEVTGYPGLYQATFTTGWGAANEGDLTGANGGVTIYRPVRQTDGVVAGIQKDWIGRLAAFQPGITRSTDNAIVMNVGYLNGLPSVGATQIGRGQGFLTSATTVAVQLTGTAAVGANSVGATDLGRTRCIESVGAHLGRRQSSTNIAGSLMTGQRDYVANNLLTVQTTAELGAGNQIYEAVMFSANAVGAGGTRNVRFRVYGGTVPENCIPCRWAPSMRGDDVNVWLLGDSQWYGTAYSTPWTFKALEQFLQRDWGSVDLPAFRFIGVTPGLSATTAQYLATGVENFDPQSGKLLATINANMAANIAALQAAGETPSIILIAAGANDAAGGATAATLLGYMANIATLAQAVWPSVKVCFTAGNSLLTGTPQATEWATVCSTLLAGSPAGWPLALDWNTWKQGTLNPTGTLAFYHSAGDWHPRVPPGETAIDAWDILAMDASAGAYTQNGAAANAYCLARFLIGVHLGATTQAEIDLIFPPLLTGEVAPV